jgi:hypothetical protein
MWLFDISNQMDSEKIKALSILSLEEVNEIGKLPNEAILGFVCGENSSISMENFRVNRIFMNFMHTVISSEALQDPSIHESAIQQKNGWLYIMDERTSPDLEAEISPEDIIGAFEVKNHQIIANSYKPNQNYSTFGSNGLMQLSASIHESLIKAIKAL